MNLFSVVTGGLGSLLIYCGVKGFNPRDVISYAFGGPKPTKIGDDGTWTQEYDLDDGSAKLDGSPDDDKKAFPDGADAGTDGYNGNPTSPSFNPTTDPPPNATGV